MGTWTPPTQFWRQHAAWAIPSALLLVIVLVLGIVWHDQTSLPAFEDQKLQIPSALKQSEAGSAANAAPGGTGEVVPNG